MFKITRAQISALNETAEARIKRKVAEQIVLKHPGWADERAALDGLIDQLFDVGFDGYGVLLRATGGLVLVAQRSDAPAAAEAPAD
jgi:hypothetical protein